MMRRKIALGIVLAGMLAVGGCGADAVESGVTFAYGGVEYDLRELEPEVNAVTACTPVGDYLVVEGHIGPNNGWYGIFNTVTGAFEKELYGANLVWRDDDIRTALYSFWSDIYDYDGVLAAACELEEPEYIRGITFVDGGSRIRVEIWNGSGSDYETFELENKKEEAL